MKDLSAKFTFKVPEDSTHADAGNKVEKTFDYQECESIAEAQATAEKKEWTLLEFVNDALKQNARANAYQSAMAVYRPSTVPVEDIKERMVRDFIRLGLSEDVARAQVESVLSANNG